MLMVKLFSVSVVSDVLTRKTSVLASVSPTVSVTDE